MTDLRLAISNLGWSASTEPEILPRLVSFGAQGIEVAPGRLADWDSLTRSVVADYRARIEAQGLVVSSLQAVFYGREDVALLDDRTRFAAMCDHLKKVTEIANTLGAGPIVFGAPKQRRRASLADAEATELAAVRMHTLGDIVADGGARIVIEPVPAVYGSDFLMTAEEVIALVRRIGHPAINVHLDTACVTLGSGEIGAAISAAGLDLWHFHVAEPDLGNFEVPRMPHRRAAAALTASGYDRWVAIEMKSRGQNDLTDVAEALRFTASCFRDLAEQNPQGAA